jgi:hypothetical protein
MRLKDDNIESLFKDLEGAFDMEAAKDGHGQRFLEKLEAKRSNKIVAMRSWFKPLAIAASIVLIASLGFVQFNAWQEQELAEVAPEMQETQTYFTSLINEELTKLRLEENPDTKIIIQDALSQITILEKDYAKLKSTLLQNGSDKRVIFAMISNLQNQAELLENVLLQIEEVKQLKNLQNENKII